MDMLKIISEIGLMETSRNLEQVLDSKDIQTRVGNILPLPTVGVSERIKEATAWLSSFGKKKYIFFLPEIALVDEIAIINETADAVFLVSSQIDPETKERIRQNLPKTIPVSIVEEPLFPKHIYPSNGILVVCGYLAGGKTMVPSDTYRMIEHYFQGFLGEKVFIPFVELEYSVRYDGWIEVESDRFNRIGGHMNDQYRNIFSYANSYFC